MFKMIWTVFPPVAIAAMHKPHARPRGEKEPALATKASNIESCPALERTNSPSLWPAGNLGGRPDRPDQVDSRKVARLLRGSSQEVF